MVIKRECLGLVFSIIFLVCILGSVSATITGVEITSPETGDYLKGEITIEWDLEGFSIGADTYNVDYYDVDVSQWKSIAAQLSSGSTSVEWNTSTDSIDDDTYQIRVQLYNVNTGLIDTSTVTDLIVDNTDPVASISDISGDWTNSDEITLDCEDENPISMKYYYFDSDGVCSSNKEDYINSVSIDTLTVDTTHNDYLCLWVDDLAGNSDYTETGFQLFVEIVEPTASLTITPTGLTNDNSVTFTPDCEDTGGSELDSCTTYVKYNGGAETSISTSETADQTYTMTDGDGTYTFYVVAIDNADNSKTSSTYDVELDETEPVISVANEETTTWYVGSSVDVETDCTDDNSCAEIKYYYSATTLDCSTKNFETNYITSDAATEQYVCAAAKDSAGNIGYSEVAEFKISSTIQSAIDSATAGDTIYVGAGTYVEDLYIDKTLELVGEDKDTTIIQGTQTEDNINFPSVGVIGNSIAAVEINADGVHIHNFTIETPDLANDEYAALVLLDGSDIEINDNIFNMKGEEGTSVDAEDDKGPVVIQTWTAANGGTEIKGLNIHDNIFQEDETNGLLKNGYYGIYLNVPTDSDASSNRISIKDNVFTGRIWRAITTEHSYVDIEGNTITTTNEDSWNYGKAISVLEWNVTDALTIQDVNVISNTIQGNSNDNGFLWGITIGTGGTDDFSDIVVTNNILKNSDVAFNVYEDAEEISFNYNLLENNTIGVQNDDDEDLDATENWWGDETGPYSASANDYPNTDGDGDDVSDNVYFRPWAYNSEVEIDYDDPTSTINSPASGSWQNNDFEVSITDADVGDAGVGICKWRLKKYDGSWSSAKSLDDRTCSGIVTITIGEEGDCDIEGENTCKIEVYVVDNSGNEGETIERTFSIDLTAPTTTDSETDTDWHSPGVVVTLTPEDTLSDVANTYYCIDQSDECTPETSGTSVTVNTEGENYVRYYSIDTAGNEEEIQTATNIIKIDNSNPSFTSITPEDTKIEKGEDVTISAEVSDSDGSGVDKVELYLDDALYGELTDGEINTGALTESTDYYLVAYDNVGNQETSETFTITVYDLVWDLSANWNLVSAPNTTSQDMGSLGERWGYDNGWDENPVEIEAGKGYWIANSDDFGLDYSSSCTFPQCLPSGKINIDELNNGWNLIGLTTTEEMSTGDAFGSWIYPDTHLSVYYVIEYDGEDFNYLNGSSMMVPGEGYWVYVE